MYVYLICIYVCILNMYIYMYVYIYIHKYMCILFARLFEMSRSGSHIGLPAHWLVICVYIYIILYVRLHLLYPVLSHVLQNNDSTTIAASVSAITPLSEAHWGATALQVMDVTFNGQRSSIHLDKDLIRCPKDRTRQKKTSLNEY